MFKINFKSFFSIILAKIIIKLSKTLFKGGTNFPGKVALKIDKNVLKVASNGYEIIFITGTNGKTTTTSMIYNMLKDSGKTVIYNGSGANMLPGILACFIEHFTFKKSKMQKYAVIEVDEANLPLVTAFITPKIITVTNLFRDQLDRYGEVYTTLNKIVEGIQKTPTTTLLLNGDESLLGELNLPNPVFYYGFQSPINDNNIIDINADAKFCKKCKSPYKYHFITYNHLGNFYCEACDYKRPHLQYAVNAILELTAAGSLIQIENQEYFINQPGIYNIYNALCAYSVAKTLEVKNEIILTSLKSQSSSFGRQESLLIDGKEIKIILVKNPAGYDQAINTVTLDKRELDMIFLLNDNYADGRDVSWIWDVHFEALTNLQLNTVLLSGIRLYDMAIRLKVAGISKEKLAICEDFDTLLNGIKNCQSPIIYTFATYTAMINFRKHLHTKGYIKNLW